MHDFIPTNMIPGLEEIGYNSNNEDSDGEENQDAMTACFNSILNHMFKDGSSWPFQTPVSGDSAPDYYNQISNPIDLGTMRTNV